MKKKSKIVQVFNKIFFSFAILFFFSGCYYKASFISKPPTKEIYQGTIWWEITYSNNNQRKVFSGYADFQAEKDFLYLRLKSPFNTSIGYGKWEASSFNLIEIFDLYHKKHYLITFKPDPELKNIPLYFLGVKEKNFTWNFLKTSFNYSFVDSEKKGIITSDLFKLEWKLKKVSVVSENFNPLFTDTSFFIDLQKIEITF